MSTWLNGLSLGRQRSKTLPSTPVLQAINTEIAKAATKDREVKERSFATAAVDSFLRLFQDYGFSSRFNHRRFRPAVSNRTNAAITTSLRNFYKQRPRPWSSPNARARLMRVARRNSARCAA